MFTKEKFEAILSQVDIGINADADARVKALVRYMADRIGVENFGKITPSEMADAIGLTGKEREQFLYVGAATKAPWKEAHKGIPCKCGQTAKFTRQKTIFVRDGKGYFTYHFKCSCGEEISREWRAVELDGKNIKTHVTTYPELFK